MTFTIDSIIQYIIYVYSSCFAGIFALCVEQQHARLISNNDDDNGNNNNNNIVITERERCFNSR